jgi:hypothetical protein
MTGGGNREGLRRGNREARASKKRITNIQSVEGAGGGNVGYDKRLGGVRRGGASEKGSNYEKRQPTKKETIGAGAQPISRGGGITGGLGRSVSRDKNGTRAGENESIRVGTQPIPRGRGNERGHQRGAGQNREGGAIKKQITAPREAAIDLIRTDVERDDSLQSWWTKWQQYG